MDSTTDGWMIVLLPVLADAKDMYTQSSSESSMKECVHIAPHLSRTHSAKAE